MTHVASAGPSLEALSDLLAKHPQGQGDGSLERLLQVTAGAPDPSKPEHVVALRVCLNAWVCRIPYPRDGVDLLASSIDPWWRTRRRRLPTEPLIDLDDRSIDDLAAAYAELASLPAGASRAGRIRSLAPTASSKLLWILRPETACPWDKAIAKAGGQGTGQGGYAHHLRGARAWARQVTAQAWADGIDDVPTHVGRPQSSLVKVYDEWCYLTITRGAK